MQAQKERWLQLVSKLLLSRILGGFKLCLPFSFMTVTTRPKGQRNLNLSDKRFRDNAAESST